MYTFRLKLVPRAEPNADGRWVEVKKAEPMLHTGSRDWGYAEIFFAGDVPEGEVMVQYERVP